MYSTRSVASRIASLEAKFRDRTDKKSSFLIITPAVLKRYEPGSVELVLFLAKRGALGKPYVVLPRAEDTMEPWNAEMNAEWEAREEDHTA